MSIFTTIRNIDIQNWLTHWYQELKFELNFHGYIEWEVIDYLPVDGANSVLAPPVLCSSVCVMAPCVVLCDTCWRYM